MKSLLTVAAVACLAVVALCDVAEATGRVGLIGRVQNNRAERQAAQDLRVEAAKQQLRTEAIVRAKVQAAQHYQAQRVQRDNHHKQDVQLLVVPQRVQVQHYQPAAIRVQRVVVEPPTTRSGCTEFFVK